MGLELSVDCPTGILDNRKVNPVDFDQLHDGRLQVVNSLQLVACENFHIKMCGAQG